MVKRFQSASSANTFWRSNQPGFLNRSWIVSTYNTCLAAIVLSINPRHFFKQQGAIQTFARSRALKPNTRNHLLRNSPIIFRRLTTACVNMDAYNFPDYRLKKKMDDPSKTPLLLVACGSFSPITFLHLRMFVMAADHVKFSTDFEIVGGYLSPVSDAYKKAGLASAEHR